MTRSPINEDLEEAIKYLRRYADTREAVLLGEEIETSLVAERLESYTRSWVTRIFVTKTIYTYNDDKPHRCPVCHTIPDSLYGGPTWKRWRVYTCRHGHRFSGLPFITKEYVSALETENGDE